MSLNAKLKINNGFEHQTEKCDSERQTKERHDGFEC